jgi:hypothetical protein
MSAELPDPGFAPGSIFRLLELRIRVQTALRAGDQAGADKWQAALEAEFPTLTKSTDPPDPGGGRAPRAGKTRGARGKKYQANSDERTIRQNRSQRQHAPKEVCGRAR